MKKELQKTMAGILLSASEFQDLQDQEQETYGVGDNHVLSAAFLRGVQRRRALKNRRYHLLLRRLRRLTHYTVPDKEYIERMGLMPYFIYFSRNARVTSTLGIFPN